MGRRGRELDLLLKDNENLERENALLESYLQRVTSHGYTAEIAEPAAPTPKKKGKSAQKALPTEVSLDQKTEIAQTEVEDLKEEIERTKDESEKLQDRLRAVMEECDMRFAQVQKDIFEFKREIVIGGENPRNGKIVAEKVVRYFEEKLRSKDSTIEKLKLKNTALKIQIQKLDKQLGEKERFSGVRGFPRPRNRQNRAKSPKIAFETPEEHLKRSAPTWDRNVQITSVMMSAISSAVTLKGFMVLTTSTTRTQGTR